MPAGMDYWDAAFAFLVATAVAALVTPLAGRFARRIGAMSVDREGGLATKSTPELGGLAILVAVLVSSALWMHPLIHLRRTPHAAPNSAGEVHTWIVLAGACMIALVGAIDDWRPLKPIVKLMGQIAAAVVAVHAGALVKNITLPHPIGALQFPHAGGVLTVIWLVALMNVVNFSDGIDGLAGGICTIDGIVFAIIAFDLQGAGSGAALLAAITAGGALGFLFHNFPPAKIFMGDTGANLLGYLLGVASVIGTLKTGALVALAMPLFILAVPFLDTGFVVAKRLKYHRKFWEADASHFHHRMANIGFSPRKTVAYLYAWTAMLGGVALALRFVPYSNHNGVYHAGWVVVMVVIVLLALAASVYLVYVLEILKFKSLRSRQLRESEPDTSEHEIQIRVQRDIETGEFERVGRRDGGG
jgi:UDP-GlcNAc:undecaprenyl-phosphate GlcNAc-1-phosphate transferase